MFPVKASETVGYLRSERLAITRAAAEIGKAMRAPAK